MPTEIVLSRYFDENVRLVAAMCSQCYQHCEDVRIVAVNGAFLNARRWTPPRSPHNLVEEELARNPWALLVATIFLNKTSCFLARPWICKFLEDFPHPGRVLERSPEDLEAYFEALGLRKRARQVWRMSHDFLHKRWRRAGELHGIGRYGEDAFRMFCLGDFGVEPRDRFLKIYKAWYLMKESGSGFCTLSLKRSGFAGGKNAESAYVIAAVKISVTSKFCE